MAWSFFNFFFTRNYYYIFQGLRTHRQQFDVLNGNNTADEPRNIGCYLLNILSRDPYSWCCCFSATVVIFRPLHLLLWYVLIIFIIIVVAAVTINNIIIHASYLGISPCYRRAFNYWELEESWCIRWPHADGRRCPYIYCSLAIISWPRGDLTGGVIGCKASPGISARDTQHPLNRICKNNTAINWLVFAYPVHWVCKKPVSESGMIKIENTISIKQTAQNTCQPSLPNGLTMDIHWVFCWMI